MVKTRRRNNFVLLTFKGTVREFRAWLKLWKEVGLC